MCWILLDPSWYVLSFFTVRSENYLTPKVDDRFLSFRHLLREAALVEEECSFLF
jgi:hypothetical protein